MKHSALLRLILPAIAVLLWAATSAWAKPPQITFSGGDGSSMNKAIVIKGATEETGVHAEYDYLEKHYSRYQRGGQSLLREKKRYYDLLDFTTADGKQKKVYFDITDFYGK